MCLRAKFRFAAAVLLASTFGFVSLTQAAPLAGVSDTVSAMQKEQMTNSTNGMIQKAHYTGYCHTHHKGHVYRCTSHHHHHYHHHYH